MSNEHIIRAWKDEEYRNSLNQEQLSQLPENPAELIELTDEDLENVAGGGLADTKYGGCGGGTRTIVCLRTRGCR